MSKIQKALLGFKSRLELKFNRKLQEFGGYCKELNTSLTPWTVQLVLVVFAVTFGSMFQFGLGLQFGPDHSSLRCYPDKIDNNSQDGEGQLIPNRTTEGCLEAAEIWPWIRLAYFLGGMAGSIWAGWGLDKFGRKMSLLSSTIVFLGTIQTLQLFNDPWNSFTILIAGKALIGICAGIYSVSALVYLAEIAPTNVRGQVCTFYAIGLMFGSLYIILQEPKYELVYGHIPSWNNLIYYPTLSSVFLLLTFVLFKCPESPRYILFKRGTHKAKHSLRWLRGDESLTIETEIGEIKRECLQSKNRPFFSQSFWLPMAVSSLIVLLHRFSALHLQLPKTEAGSLPPLMLTVCAPLVPHFVMELGRKSTLVFGLELIIIQLVARTLVIPDDLLKQWKPPDNYFQNEPMVVVFAGVFILSVFFSIGLMFRTMCVMIPEMFDQRTRAVGTSFAMGLNWMILSIEEIEIPRRFILKTISQNTNLSLFATITPLFMLLLLLWVYIPETSLKSFVEITDYFSHLELAEDPSINSTVEDSAVEVDTGFVEINSCPSTDKILLQNMTQDFQDTIAINEPAGVLRIGNRTYRLQLIPETGQAEVGQIK